MENAPKKEEITENPQKVEDIKENTENPQKVEDIKENPPEKKAENETTKEQKLQEINMNEIQKPLEKLEKNLEEIKEPNKMPKKRESNSQIESIEIYNSKNVNSKKGTSKNLELLAKFFSEAPQNIVNKNQNDTKSFTKNYQESYEKVIKLYREENVINFFF